ncbi:hypothetical protein D0T53_09480 [Dysgonomonas sp. 216]|uniref:phage virion morphogenesis protein n=1 Tax=Dysgonomonas sp. 216 TaxID=2302934 RepID=UPI0013D330E6|nr:phage virion morphogenesis protein [Dysgonomonas sp. 216]NDW19141.1 hypothetical protein [Dysgonomonas sp. 216]
MNEDYSKIFDRISTAVNNIPTKVATVAVNFSKERFVEKNWINKRKISWKKTKKKRGSTLVASGRLKRSIRKITVTPQYVSIGTDVPYARAHNEGLEISGTESVKQHTRKQHRRRSYIRKDKRIKAQIVKSHTVKQHSRKYKRKFVKRQFIGQSQELEDRITKLINSEISKAIKG